jgi:proteasome lid subunit RPN8/RPN11
MMQVHAHLIKNEIIGFLAGYDMSVKGKDGVKNENKTLVITEAYPAEGMEQEGETQENLNMERNVELNPESATNINSKIEKRKQNILGWYHSHPIFEA